MQNDTVANEQAFQDLVNSIIGEPTNTMDPCFDAGVVENYLERNTVRRAFCLGSKVVEVGRENVSERGLASYVQIEGPDEFKKYVLWPSTSVDDGRDGLCLYYSPKQDETYEVDSSQLTNLIFTLADLAMESNS